ncbi:hypothetical protein PVAG01_08035 [Phlyctema vagabunda]|uniref:Arca-like protein n=1 Tax=Phlyctema vagabunda TaxID=108571 RepID=A0ABR4PE90_9HELO
MSSATPGSVSGNTDVAPSGSPKEEKEKEEKKPSKTLRFRHGSSARYDTDFPMNQSWVRVSGNICSDFVDETPELDELYGRRGSNVPRKSPPQVEHGTNVYTISHMTSSPSRSLLQGKDDGDNNSQTIFPANNDADHHESSSLQNPKAHESSVSVENYSGQDRDHGGDLSHEPRSFLSWPLSDIQEACLMRYFIDHLACWFDLCDPDRHFALVVPQRASNCPALLYAIFTASARHLCRIEQSKHGTGASYLGQSLPGLQMETAVEYHNRCIENLASMSSDSHAVFDENLLAASVILRFYEEVDAPFHGGDLEPTLRASQFFIDAQVQASIHDTGLRRAAFRVAYRQELVIAYINQRAFRLPIHPFLDCLSLEPVDDHSWAHRAVVHCAHVLTYCYGENRSNKEDYDILKEYSQAWDLVKPPSFTPLYERNVDVTLGEFHPEIWFLSDCHVTGVQHHSLSKILLTVYNPRIPRLGPGQRDANRKIETELRVIVRQICGKAISNRRAPPAMNTACMAIAICGDLFNDPREQQALLDILQFTEIEHAWPTTTIQQKLKLCWGCENPTE